MGELIRVKTQDAWGLTIAGGKWRLMKIPLDGVFDSLHSQTTLLPPSLKKRGLQDEDFVVVLFVSVAGKTTQPKQLVSQSAFVPRKDAVLLADTN